MNIAIFTNNYLPNPYGVARSIESFRHQFESRGHRVFIFAPKHKKYKDKNNIFRYPSVDIKYKISFPLPLPFSFKISRILKNLDFDIIHSQHPNLLGREAFKWSKRKNIPLIFTWHTLYDQYTHFVPIISSQWSASWIIKKAVSYANKADYVIVPTESIEEIIKNWGVINEKIIVIPTGVEEAVYQNSDKNIIRSKYNIRENEILLLLVSRLTLEKNIEFLFSAVIEILKTNKKLKFLVVGEGDLFLNLKKAISKVGLEKQVIFAGMVAKEEIKNYYAAADIFVYASKSETQGMVISEAMYMGLPIVAVNATGVKNLVENNLNGFLVPERKDVFVQAVLKLVNNKELREKFKQKSIEISRNKYTDKICAEKMLKIYQKAINEKKVHPS